MRRRQKIYPLKKADRIKIDRASFPGVWYVEEDLKKVEYIVHVYEGGSSRPSLKFRVPVCPDSADIIATKIRLLSQN